MNNQEANFCIRTYSAILPDEQATCKLAENLSNICSAGSTILLFGDLGVGKTAFARAFISAKTGLNQEVPSPTFTLLQTYDVQTPEAATPLTIFHFDLYRLSSPDEAYELAIEDAFSEGICLIEWPDRLEGLVPRERLEVSLYQGETENSRRIELVGNGIWVDKLTSILPGDTIDA